MMSNGRGGSGFLAAVAGVVLATGAAADERKFGYVYEADVLPPGGLEFEQHLTARAGKDEGRYARWDFREELEYGLTERLTTAFYLNFEDEFRSGGKGAAEGGEDENSGLDFAGFSSEWKYQLASPIRDPLGVLLYAELSSDLAHETELEEKLVLSKNWDEWVAAFNAVVEQEWEYEEGATEKEGALELTAGISRKLNQHWSTGLELRHSQIFAENFEFKDQAHSAFFLGPNVAFATGRGWATLSVLPQVHGTGDPAEDGLNLDEYTRMEVRLLVGIPL